MSDFEPIDIEILINEPQVMQSAQNVADSLRGMGSASDDALKEITKNTEQIGKAVTLAASQLQTTTTKGGVSVIYPDASLAADKKNVDSIVDYAKQEQEKLKQLAEANAYYGTTPNTSTNNKNNVKYVNGSPVASASSSTATAQDVLGKQFADVLAMGQAAFKSLDTQTQEYMLSLIDLNTALSTVTQAESALIKSFNDGKISESEYSATLAQLQSAHEVIANEIEKLTTIQETAATLNNLENATLKEKKAALEQLRAEYQSLTEKQQQNADIGGKVQQQITELTASINEQSETITKNNSILAEYRQLRDQIAKDAVNGIVNPEDVARAAQLEQAIKNTNAQLQLSASNVSGIKAIGEGMQGLVGAFTAASGVISIFSDDNSKAQKILQDTVAVMFAFNGVQQAAQVLNKNSRVNLYLKSLLSQKTAVEANTAATVTNTTVEETNIEIKEANAVATNAQTGATETQIVVTDGATAAQWSLNAAMNANPLGVIIIAITALIALYESLASILGKNIESQTKLNKAMTEAQGIMNSIVEIGAQRYKDALTAAESQLALMTATKQSSAAIKEQKDNVIAARQALNDYKATALLAVGNEKGYTPSWMPKDTTTDIEKVTERYNLLNKQLSLEQNKLLILNRTDGSEDFVDNAKSNVERLEAQIAPLKSIVEEQVKIQNDAAVQQAQYQEEQYQKGLQSDTAYWQSRVTLAQKGSEEWLKAQLSLNKATYQKAVSQPDITSGEAANAAAAKYEADLQAHRDYNIQKLQDDRDTIAAQLDAATQGSAEELALKLRDLEDETQQKIIAAKNNAALIERINADSLKKQNDLKIQYAQADVERALSIQKSIAQVNVSSAHKDSYDAYVWGKQQSITNAQAQAEQALKQAQAGNPNLGAGLLNEIPNLDTSNYQQYADKIDKIDADLAGKIRAIFAQLKADLKKSDDDWVSNKIASANKIIDAQTKIKNSQAEAILHDSNSSQTAKLSAKSTIDTNDIDGVIKKLQNLDAYFIQTYGSAGVAISQFTQNIIAGTTSLDAFEMQGTAANESLSAIGNDKHKEELLGLVAAFKELKESIKETGEEKLNALIAEVAKLGETLTGLGEAVSQTDSGLGETLQTMGSLVTTAANFASGMKAIKTAIDAAKGAMDALNTATIVLEVIVLVIQAVTAVVKLFSQAKASAAEAAAEMQKYQEQLVLGAAQYNAYLAQQLKLQGSILQGKLDEIKAQEKLNKDQQDYYNMALAIVKQQLLSKGQYITGEHTEKYGGFLGIGQKTKVVQDMASLSGAAQQYSGFLGSILSKMGLNKQQTALITPDMSNDDIAKLLKMLELEGKLTGQTKDFADEFIQLNDSINQAVDQAAQLQEQLAEAFSGTTGNDIAKAITDGLQKGYTSVEQFGTSFKSIIANSLLSSITSTLESGALKKVWQDFITYSQSGDQLTPDQIAQLKSDYNAAVQQGLNEWQNAQKIFPDLVGALSQTATGLSGQIQQQITEQTADELAGIMRGMYDEMIRQTGILYEQGNNLAAIQINTAAAVSQLQEANDSLTTIAKNTKPVNTSRDNGI